MEGRDVDFLDIAFDEIKPHHYKESEDPKLFKSEKSGRGPLVEGWRDNHKPIMCCYKVVHAKFEVWGLQTKVEDYVQAVCKNSTFDYILLSYRYLFNIILFKAIREILLLGHRQAFTWMDEWFNMTIDDVRAYERDMQAKTNMKVKYSDRVVSFLFFFAIIKDNFDIVT